MNKARWLAFAFIALLASSCDGFVPIVEDVQVTVGFTFRKGESMTKATNAEIFDEFYEAIVDGSLVAENFSLTLVNNISGSTYKVSGTWNDGNTVSIMPGIYTITGTATAAGDFVQGKCSIVLNDTVTIADETTQINIAADYDCALVIFADNKVSSVTNNAGLESTSLWKFKDYFYAFVRPQVYAEESKDTANYSVVLDGETYLIPTGGISYTYGKYYVYHDVLKVFGLEAKTPGVGFDLGNMGEGSDSE